MVDDLTGERGVEGVDRYVEHLVASDECDMPGPQLGWPGVELFVAPHNWPDPVSIKGLAGMVVGGIRARHELHRLEQEVRR